MEAIKAPKVKGIQVRFDEEGPVDFSNVFSSMKQLRFLDISTSRRSDDKEPKVLPNNLRWVSWSGYPGRYLPTDFHANELVVLRMTFSKIVHLSEEHKRLRLMPRLKMLDLSGSQDLISIPTVTNFPNLEKLILQNCCKLEMIDQSIGSLERLVVLDMSCCSKLSDFSPTLRMASLKVLNLSGCTNLRNFPQFHGSMKSLEELSLQSCRIRNLRDAIGKMSSLVSIDLCYCKRLTSLPHNLSELKKLRSLKLNGCLKLEELPGKLGDLECLEELLLNDVGIKQLPDSIMHIKNLKTLSFKYAEEAGTSKRPNP